MAIVETKIEKFDGGITNDPRNPAANVARVVTNFETLKTPKKMSPYRSSEDGDSSSDTIRIRNFAVAKLNTTPTYAIYGLGRTSAASPVVEIYYKLLTTGASNDLDDATWTETANNTAAGATNPNFNLFVFYPRTGFIYAARNGSHIFPYDPDGSSAFDETNRALTYTQIGQGVVHSKDDILYIPYFNAGGFIARNNNGTWNNTALTLPTHYIPTSICEYGNYLAIGCAHTDGVSPSRVFLWDRDSSLTTVDESIDWGAGSLIILAEVDGELIGISQRGGAVTSFTGIPNATTVHRDSLIFRQLVGRNAVEIYELQANHSGSANTTKLPLYKQVIDNRLYFQMLIELNGAVRDGVWSFGRSSPYEPFSLIHERSVNNDTALAAADELRGFYFVGDYLLQSYLASSVQAMSKTNDSATYSHNSVYETKRFDGSIHGYDSSYYKDLIDVTVTTEYMPTAGQVIIQYRTDQNTSWTTIFTNSTDNSISRTGLNIASTGAALPKDYKEIEFRVVSSGGAEITGIIFKEDIKGRKYNTA